MSSTEAVKTRDNSKVLDLVYIAIGAALIAICSWISIPTAVPFTLQTFAIFFVLLALGGMILLVLGLIGEYIGRMYICQNQSPQYVIRRIVNADSLKRKEETEHISCL